jgi:transcriptional regulator with XRE-family HTH domain
MPPENPPQRESKPTLGQHLAGLRAAADLKLREVEERSDGEISNAYLSQLENNKIKKPDPSYLHTLAEIYNTSYEDLMYRAGYLPPPPKAPGKRQAQAATFAIKNLTPDEEQVLIEYLAFFRKQKRK